MKRLAWLSLMFAVTPALGLAQDDTRFYVGVTAGLVMPRNLLEHWQNTDGSGETAALTEVLDDGFSVGLSLGYMPPALDGLLALAAEYSYQQSDLKAIGSTGFTAFDNEIPTFFADAEDSRLECQSLHLSVVMRVSGGGVHPYVGIAPGLTRSSISFNEPELVGPFGFVEEGDDTSFSYQLLGGVDFDVSPVISVGVGYKYLSVEPTMTWQNGTFSDYDYSSHNFVFDFKYHF
jgi:opacity protein-like surface antigen